MKKYFIILSLFLSLLASQDRSVIFNTGSPDSLTHGYEISSSQSVANRFSVANDYVLEAMVFYMRLNSPSGSVNVSIREDNNGSPGELVSDLAQWNHVLDPITINGYNLIVTTDLCIYLDAGNNYWYTIEAGDIQTDALWIYSNAFGYNHSIFEQETGEWNTSIGYAGAGGVWAEQVYDPPYDLGDVNSDFLTNVVDIVLIVGHILDTNPLNNDIIEYGDLNLDGMIDVVDLVQLVNLILSEASANPSFALEDLNPASEYYGQNIGPSFFNGQVSAYYFGKQG
jgi:hypothetical protein